jgi:hypothetical protein
VGATAFLVWRHRSVASRALLGLLAGAGPIACSGSSAPQGSKTFSADAYQTTTADSGALSVQVRTSPQPPQRGTIRVELTVTNVGDGTPRDGLTLDVVPWMPAHNHGTSVVPTVAAEGQGKYLVTGVDLFMPGHWELRTTFSGPVTDHAAPAFDVP